MSGLGMASSAVAGFFGGKRLRVRQRRGHWNAVQNVLLELDVIREVTDRRIERGTPITGRFEAWTTHYRELRDRSDQSLPDMVGRAVAAVYARLSPMENATDEEAVAFRDLVLQARHMLIGYCAAFKQTVAL
jgi:hypothetical protein